MLDMWITRAQRGELFSHLPGKARPAPAVTGGVDTWKKSTALSAPSQTLLHQAGDGDTAPILIGSGGSARTEMLLERLPYLPTILRRSSTPSPNTASTIREIRKITSLTGAGPSLSAEDDENEDPDDLEGSEVEQWATDVPDATPKKKRRVRIQVKEEAEVESAIAGAVGAGEEAGGNVLSDDDIED
jgi:cell cycle checkpoint protein